MKRFGAKRADRRRGWAHLLAFFGVACAALALAAPADARRHHRHASAHESANVQKASVARPAAATEGAVRNVVVDASGYAGQLNLPIGGSKILKFNQPVGRVLLGDPKVGDVVPLSDRTLYVLGKGAGTTNLTVLRGDTATPIATLDLKVGYDIDSLKRALSDLMPGEPLEVSARGDGLVITGVATSSAAAARAASLAEHYAPQKVVNLMSVRGAEQVMLSVHVAEVQRSAIKQLGITSLQSLWNDDSGGGGSLPPLTLNPDALLNLIGHTTIGNLTLEGVFNALESRGYATTLAEPRLTALSGETAVFFAGGEIPVPVPQLNSSGQNQITIDYKPYGVSVGFTPTVVGDTINLTVSPEVSALDKDNAVVLQGFRVPALTTRRAKTTVDLKNGQSFAIAGLIKKDFSDSLRGLPGAQNVPILGALFRSTAFQNNETEVVIVVTVHLAKPTTRQNLLLPTEITKAPTEPGLFLLPNTDYPVGKPKP